MQNLVLGANTPLNQTSLQIRLHSEKRLGQQLGAVWLPLNANRQIATSPAYLHEPKDWANMQTDNDPKSVIWQLDLNKVFSQYQCQFLQLVVYEYQNPDLSLPAVEVNDVKISVQPDDITYFFHTNERHIKSAIIFEIYQRNGQYKCKALAETSSQSLNSFSQNLQVSLDARHPTIHQELGQNPNHRRPQTGETWTGTAFAIDPYHLLTCHHVIDGANLIGLRQEGFADLQAQVVISDEGSDTALLKVSERLPHYLPLRELGCDLLGENVVTLGFPLAGVASQLQVTQGNIAGLRGIGGDIRYLQFTAPIQSGSSGSPLLLTTGEVVGMVTHTISNTQNMNYATKYQLLSAIVASSGLNLNDLPKTHQQNLTTPQLTKQSRQALWLVGCQA